MNELTQSAASVPSWLPAWLESTWRLLGAYPFLLALMILLVGLSLAFLVPRFILYWGLRIADRANAELTGKLLRVGARVAGLLVGYISLVTALHTLALREFATSIIIRVLLSLLVLQLMRASLQASRIVLEMFGKIRDRFAIVEERTVPLFDLMMIEIPFPQRDLWVRKVPDPMPR